MIGLVAAPLGLLPLGFQHIKVGEPCDSAEAVEKLDGKPQPAPHAHEVAKKGREHAEANHVAEAVQLDAEALFRLRPVLFAPGHPAVKSVADPGQAQAQHRQLVIPMDGLGNAQDGTDEAYVRQYDRIVVNPDKMHF